MRVPLYPLFFIVILCCFSCQKELSEEATPPDINTGSTDVSNSIVGKWKFVSIEATTQSSAESKIDNANQKILAFLNYSSQENDGIIIIDSIAMNCSGITYKVLSRIKAYKYKNDILVDSVERPYKRTFPQTDSYTTYQLNADSIFFKKGGFTNIAASRFKVSASVAKIELKDSLLVFTQPIYKDSVQNIAGIKAHIIQKGTAIMTLKRQL